MGALVALTERLFPIDTDRLRAGLDKLQGIRDGAPGLVTPYEARAVLAAVTRYEAMCTECGYPQLILKPRDTR
jgi:hypothetical protein